MKGMALALMLCLALPAAAPGQSKGGKMQALKLTSTAFSDNGRIPVKYSCKGQNINPPLAIDGLPKGTTSLVLVVTDPDAPGGNFVHWLLYDIKPVNTISENSAPGTVGRNSVGENKYTGPCPPGGTHHYHFMVYALDSKPGLKEGASMKDVEQAMQGHILGAGHLVGLFSR